MLDRRAEQAAADLEWYFTEGELLFDVQGSVDYERPVVQIGCSGDPTNDVRHQSAAVYLRMRDALLALPPWARRALELRYRPVGWAKEGELQDWWAPYGQWANVIKTLKVKGETTAQRIVAARRIVDAAIGLYLT